MDTYKPTSKFTRWASALFHIIVAFQLANAADPAKPGDNWIEPFNGRDLTGWDGEPGFWRVEGGVLVGETTPEHKVDHHSYLIWRGGEVRDFELRVKFRIAGKSANSGVQYRSKDLGNHEVAGYQCNIEPSRAGFTAVLEEMKDREGKRRHGHLAEVGEAVRFAANGERKVSGMTGKPAEVNAGLMKDDWNDLTILAEGPCLRHWLNGKLAVDVTDEDAQLSARNGVLALQLHLGPPMKVEFKDMRLRNIGEAASANATAAPALTEAAFTIAASHGALVQEGLNRCNRYLHAWLNAADPTTGLIPRNLTDSPYWNGKDSAADNYPFMVLSADLTERPLLAAKLRLMLQAERKLTARPGWLRLTDDYNLKDSPGLRQPIADAERIFFNSAEYVKDGLLALTEWLGPSPWSERMFELVDDSFVLAAVDSPFGKIPLNGTDKAVGVEVSGDYLQALARIYWMSGRDEKYLRWGIRLADNFLLPEGKNHPTRDFATLRLRDHGCEIISGLCEFYAALHYAGQLPGGREWAEKKTAYQPHVHEMLDRTLAVGRNADGLFYNEVNPRTGAIVDANLSDSWGYVYDAYYTVFLVDSITAYREAIVRPLAALDKNYRSYNWEPRGDHAKFPLGSHDGYADSIESALNLYNRFTTDSRIASVTAWMDSEIKHLWSSQQPNGIIEGWHGDGNFARTTIMYCLWKTQGVTVQPWRADLRLGAARDAAGTLCVVLSAEKPWNGSLIFDTARHAENLRLPVDWPRINQFPEWLTVLPQKTYSVYLTASSPAQHHTGAQLAVGIPVSVSAAEPLRLTLSPR